MCANVKPLRKVLASLPEVPDIEDKQASIGLFQYLKSKCDPSLQLLLKAHSSRTGKTIQDGAAAIRYLLSLCATKDERDKRDA